MISKQNKSINNGKINTLPKKDRDFIGIFIGEDKVNSYIEENEQIIKDIFTSNQQILNYNSDTNGSDYSKSSKLYEDIIKNNKEHFLELFRTRVFSKDQIKRILEIIKKDLDHTEKISSNNSLSFYLSNLQDRLYKFQIIPERLVNSIKKDKINFPIDNEVFSENRESKSKMIECILTESNRLKLLDQIKYLNKGDTYSEIDDYNSTIRRLITEGIDTNNKKFNKFLGDLADGIDTVFDNLEITNELSPFNYKKSAVLDIFLKTKYSDDVNVKRINKVVSRVISAKNTIKTMNEGLPISFYEIETLRNDGNMDSFYQSKGISETNAEQKGIILTDLEEEEYKQILFTLGKYGKAIFCSDSDTEITSKMVKYILSSINSFDDRVKTFVENNYSMIKNAFKYRKNDKIHVKYEQNIKKFTDLDINDLGSSDLKTQIHQNFSAQVDKFYKIEKSNSDIHLLYAEMNGSIEGMRELRGDSSFQIDRSKSIINDIKRGVLSGDFISVSSKQVGDMTIQLRSEFRAFLDDYRVNGEQSNFNPLGLFGLALFYNTKDTNNEKIDFLNNIEEIVDIIKFKALKGDKIMDSINSLIFMGGPGLLNGSEKNISEEELEENNWQNNKNFFVGDFKGICGKHKMYILNALSEIVNTFPEEISSILKKQAVNNNFSIDFIASTLFGACLISGYKDNSEYDLNSLNFIRVYLQDLKSDILNEYEVERYNVRMREYIIKNLMIGHDSSTNNKYLKVRLAFLIDSFNNFYTEEQLKENPYIEAYNHIFDVLDEGRLSKSLVVKSFAGFTSGINNKKLNPESSFIVSSKEYNLEKNITATKENYRFGELLSKGIEKTKCLSNTNQILSDLSMESIYSIKNEEIVMDYLFTFRKIIKIVLGNFSIDDGLLLEQKYQLYTKDVLNYHKMTQVIGNSLVLKNFIIQSYLNINGCLGRLTNKEALDMMIESKKIFLEEILHRQTITGGQRLSLIAKNELYLDNIIEKLKKRVDSDGAGKIKAIDVGQTA